MRSAVSSLQGVAGVDRRARLDQDDLGPVCRHRLVLHAPRHHAHLARSKLNVAGVKLDGQVALKDQEELVGLWVAMEVNSPLVFTSRTS
jgi:hypothetical protein